MSWLQPMAPARRLENALAVGLATTALVVSPGVCPGRDIARGHDAASRPRRSTTVPQRLI